MSNVNRVSWVPNGYITVASQMPSFERTISRGTRGQHVAYKEAKFLIVDQNEQLRAKLAFGLKQFKFLPTALALSPMVMEHERQIILTVDLMTGEGEGTDYLYLRNAQPGCRFGKLDTGSFNLREREVFPLPHTPEAKMAVNDVASIFGLTIELIANPFAEYAEAEFIGEVRGVSFEGWPEGIESSFRVTGFDSKRHDPSRIYDTLMAMRRLVIG